MAYYFGKELHVSFKKAMSSVIEELRLEWFGIDQLGSWQAWEKAIFPFEKKGIQKMGC